MRRTALLLASVALAVLLACGIALAAEITCLPARVVGNCMGTINDDTMTGTAGGDEIYARRGDDFVKGLGGLDLIVGGRGNDTIHGNDKGDTLEDGAGNDIVYGGEGGDSFGVFFESAGNDTYYGGEGNDDAWTGNGRDKVYMGAGDDEVHSQATRPILLFGVARRPDETPDRINCGPGQDEVWFDSGRGASARDIIARNCEVKHESRKR
jgi:Ca2+-binding RTX toxin-like protein